MIGRRLAAAVALAFALGASPVFADDPAEQQRIGAVTVEWIIANCDASSVPAFTLMVSMMVLNGSDPAELEPYRRRMRDGVATNYPDRAAACADMVERIAAP